MIIYTTFDIADQSFKFYTEDEWLDFMLSLREELLEDEYANRDAVFDMGWDELIEHFWGGEMFFDSVDSNYVKN